MTKAFAKNEQLLELAKKCNDPTTITDDLEKWLNDVTVENDEILKKARDYIDKCPQLDKSSQSSHRTTTVKSKSSKATSSKVSKTSSQRQRDLIIAQQRREEIEKQNEAIIRLAKQKQQLEIEQQELELQRLRKEQALRVEELEEENRRKLAEATLAEMELREDLSDSNLDFHVTLSRLSATSKGNGTERINEWINNSPNGAEVPTTAASTNPYRIQITPQQAQIAGTQVTNEAVATNFDASAAFLPTFSSQLPVFNVTNPHQTSAVQPPKTFAAAVVVPTPATVQSRLPQPVSTTTTQATTIQSQVLPHPPLVPINPTLTVPVIHIPPNLSAWTFPSVTSNLPTQDSTALLPNQPIQVTSTSTLLGSTPVPSVPTIPVACRGTVYYVPPPVITTPAVVGTSTQPSSWLPSANAASIFPAQANTVPPTSSACFTLPEVAQLLASTEKDHLPEWKLSQYNGDPVQWHEWFGQFKSAIDSASLSDDVKLTYLKTLVTGKAKVAIAELWSRVQRCSQNT